MSDRVKGLRDYLGDGVYIDLDVYGNVILTTEDGVSVQNTIVMDQYVVEAFERWKERAEKVVQDVKRVT